MKARSNKHQLNNDAFSLVTIGLALKTQFYVRYLQMNNQDK